MDPIKIAAVVVWAVLFLVGVSAYVAGWSLDRPHLKSAGEWMIGAWCLVDLILIILAFTLGWFP